MAPFSNLQIARLEPEPKDIQRAAGLRSFRGVAKGDNTPYKSLAAKMAKAIEDPYKLVRRAKAVAQMYGTGPYFADLLPFGQHWDQDWIDNNYAWEPFAEALLHMGFTPAQVQLIAGV